MTELGFALSVASAMPLNSSDPATTVAIMVIFILHLLRKSSCRDFIGRFGLCPCEHWYQVRPRPTRLYDQIIEITVFVEYSIFIRMALKLSFLSLPTG